MEERTTFAIEKLSGAMRDCLLSDDGEVSFVDAVEDLARAIYYATKQLGIGDDSTRMGALELHGDALIEGSKIISEAIYYLAGAIREQKTKQSVCCCSGRAPTPEPAGAPSK
jgi:hypothetical protein